VRQASRHVPHAVSFQGTKLVIVSALSHRELRPATCVAKTKMLAPAALCEGLMRDQPLAASVAQPPDQLAGPGPSEHPHLSVRSSGLGHLRGEMWQASAVPASLKLR